MACDARYLRDYADVDRSFLAARLDPYLLGCKLQRGHLGRALVLPWPHATDSSFPAMDRPVLSRNQAGLLRALDRQRQEARYRTRWSKATCSGSSGASGWGRI